MSGPGDDLKKGNRRVLSTEELESLGTGQPLSTNVPSDKPAVATVPTAVAKVKAASPAKGYMFYLTREQSESIDNLIVEAKIPRLSRSDIHKAGMEALKGLSSEAFNRILQQVMDDKNKPS